MKHRHVTLVGILLVGIMLISGCVEGAAKSGDTVKVRYTGRLADDTIFDTSVGREPLEFTVGSGRLIPRFEQAVIGMKRGEPRTITILAEEAYGPHYQELVFVIGRDYLPGDLEPEIGSLLHVQLTVPNGPIITGIVLNVSETSVTIDANHRLAGRDLTFDIELVEIVEVAQ